MNKVYNHLLAVADQPKSLGEIAGILTKKYQKLLGLVLVFCLLNIQAYAQTKVSGKVLDAKGEGLPGATIIEKGTTNGTSSLSDGSFSINVKPDATLIFSFVGYATQEIVVGAQTVINVTLTDDAALQEVVVVGYGTQKKSDVTGVVTKIDSKNFNKGPIVSPDQLINGKIAGVQVQSNSGEPGGQTRIRIRGGTSINASNEPLYVIDGVPIDNTAVNPGGFQDGRNPLNFLNPDDIESFTVLKDASATAIYGSRGNNGVIIITTKKGRSGKGKLNYSNWFSVGSIANKIDVFNAAEFRTVVQDKASGRVNELGNTSTNWQDQLYQTAIGQNHSLSYAGGIKGLNYRTSLGYLKQDGTLKGTSAERISFALGLNAKLFKQLNVDANIKLAQNKDTFSPNSIIGGALRMDPTQAIFDANDTQYGGYFEYANDLATKNPVAELALTDDQGKNLRTLGNIKFDYQMPFLKGLSANLNLGYDHLKGDRQRTLPTNLRSQSGTLGEHRTADYTKTNSLLEFYLKYTKDFKEINSRLDITGGYSYQDFREEYIDSVFTDLTGATPKNKQGFKNIQKNRLISFYGRVNFSYADKLLLTATLRRDGSSRFGLNNRWGSFPSVAAAYRLSEEAFLKNSKVISDLKIRAGYGITGNQDIAGQNFAYLPTYTLGDSTAAYQFGNTFVNTIRPNAYDQNLKWEEVKSFNIGLDFGLFAGRLSGSVEYYKKTTKDLLFTVPVAAGANLSDRVLTNVGELENSGVEFALDAVAINSKAFQWNVGFNIAWNRNTLLRFSKINDPAFVGILTGGILGGTGNTVQILQMNQAANSFYLFKHKMGTDGKPLVDGIDHNGDGNIDNADIYEDINGPDGKPDGRVDELDKRAVENPAPNILMGLTSNMRFKGFDLSFTFRANLGNYVYNNVKSNGAYYNRVINEIVPTNMPRSVTETNFVAPQYFSDVYLEDASFLRLDNITLGYTFDQLLKNKFNLRAYVTAQNLFVITNYSGLDPEVANKDALGIDNDIFPRARTIIMGLSLGF
ncbi:SusC/RagA family TonB-linked outer membrane protein [Microscilla marina]|uniref:Outer membrane protein n=1 Tax=Microscilla marina ATCC 23134 TaxID=313606 RepID=A1ZWA2_MICM2|nr:TonB-dependent receptor [Microscilla marina]EAY25340.1 outer membrane protein [Microscilla marina ATCC 23134]